MRGKVFFFDSQHLRIRITPAYAGKSENDAISGFFGVDHPRLCGEKFPLRTVLCGKQGSPPPMRGKADVVQQAVSCIGITPAYAGKSRFSYEIRSTS